MKELLKKLITLEKDPKLAIYSEIEEINEKLNGKKDQREKLKRLITLEKDPKLAVFTELEEINKALGRFVEIKKGDKGDPGKDGKDGVDGRDGKDGKNGLNGKNGAQGERGKDGRDGRDGKDGKDGIDGLHGDKGDKPKHEWEGTKLRFERPDGKWGKYVDLAGKDGLDGRSGQTTGHSRPRIKKDNKEVFDDPFRYLNFTGGVSVKYDSDGQYTVNVEASGFDTNLLITPTVSLSGGGTYEVGQTIEDVNLAWVCNKTMKTRNLSAPVPLIDRPRGEGKNGSYTHEGANISTNTTYSITVSDGVNSATASTSLAFRLMFYWGISNETSLNNAQILALNKALKTSTEVIEFSINAGGQYIYFLYPTAWGAKDVYVNGFVMTDWDLTVYPVTNTSGYTTNYNVVRSRIKQNGDNIIITLKKYGQ